MGPLVVDTYVIGVTIYTPYVAKKNYLHSEGRYILVVVVELRFNALYSLYSTLLLPPLFPIVGRRPFPPAHCSPARAIFLGSSRVPYPPAHCSATRGEASSLARPNPLPRWLAGTENPNGRTG